MLPFFIMKRHVKVAKNKNRYQKNTKFFNIFNNGDKISFVFSSKHFNSKIYTKIGSYCLSVKTTVKGTKSVNFYDTTGGRVRITSPYMLNHFMLSHMVKKYNGKGDLKPRILGFPKTWIAKIKKEIKFFCKQNGLPFNDSMKEDIFDQMFLLCYPGYKDVFPKEQYRALPPFALAKKDLLKGLFQTNGSATRRKFFEFIKKQYTSYNSFIPIKHRAFKVLYKLRVKYGLDMVQYYMDTNDDPWNRNTLILKCLHFNSYRMKELIRTENRYLHDAALQLRSLSDYGIFPDFTRYSSIKELHDESSILLRDVRRNHYNGHSDHSYSCLLSLSLFAQKFNSYFPDYELRFPSDYYELSDWGSYMGNCVLGYSGNIFRGTSNILGMFKDDVLIYNIDINNLSFMTQMMGKYNRCPPEDIKLKMIELCNETGINTTNTYW